MGLFDLELWPLTLRAKIDDLVQIGAALWHNLIIILAYTRECSKRSDQK